MLDASAQHAGRTGREILTIAQRTMGLPGRPGRRDAGAGQPHRDRADRRVGNYSLGMRQRLGIAAALIGEPSVLILDEPANGLDPAGIRWMRDLLRAFADQGGTVLLSSHLLHEVEIIADDIVMIGRGRIVSRAPKQSSSGGQAPSSGRATPKPWSGRCDVSGLVYHRTHDGALHTDAEPTVVGLVASSPASRSPSCARPTAASRRCSSR